MDTELSNACVTAKVQGGGLVASRWINEFWKPPLQHIGLTWEFYTFFSTPKLIENIQSYCKRIITNIEINHWIYIILSMTQRMNDCTFTVEFHRELDTAPYQFMPHNWTTYTYWHRRAEEGQPDRCDSVLLFFHALLFFILVHTIHKDILICLCTSSAVWAVTKKTVVFSHMNYLK